MRSKKIWSAILSGAMVFTTVCSGTGITAQADSMGNITTVSEENITVNSEDAVDESVAVEYSMSGAVDGKLTDISGHGNDAVIHNPEAVDFITEDGKSIMEIQDAAGYLDLPAGIMDDLTDKEAFTIEATYSRSAKAGGTSWLFCFGSVPKQTGTNYLFYCPYFSFGDGQVRAGIKDSKNEKLFETGLQNQNDTYYTVNMVFDHGTIRLYQNGVKIGGDLNSGYSIVEDVINGGTADGILGYIGKSCWAQDTNFVGKIASFKIYDKAMTDSDVQLSNPEYQENLQKLLDEGIQTEDLLGNRNASADQIAYDLTLPLTLDEMEVVWSSSDPDVISEEGKVSNGQEDRTVTLTARVETGVLAAEKAFTLTVKKMDRTELDELLEQAEEALLDPEKTPEEIEAIQKAVEDAKSVTSQAQVAAVVFGLKLALGVVDYQSVAVDKSTGGNPVAGFNEAGEITYGGDPSILVDGDTVYLYVGNDVSEVESYNIPRYLCYSTKDMENWTYEGEVMEMTDVAWGANDSAWAGQVMKHNGKYYMYFCSWNNQDNGRQSIGVAVADSPTGPFVDKGEALIKGSVTQPESSIWNDIDPTAWIETDENGEEHIYLAWGNSKWYMCELNDDMVSVKDQNQDGKISMNQDIWEQTITGMDGSFTEAPYLYRQQDENGNYYGKYYMFYAMNWREEMAYCTKDDINDFTEPWVYGGKLMPPSATANTNHSAVFDFKGSTYFIYHTGVLPWGSGYRRVTCVEEFSVNEDGTIDPIQETATGLTGTSSQILDFEQAPIAHENWTNTLNDGDYPITKSVGADSQALAEDTMWEILPGKADKEDPYCISIESYNKPGLYLSVSGEELVLTQDAKKADKQGMTADSESMTFRTLKGFSGTGVTLESVAKPGYFVVSENGKLVLSQNPDLEKCSFTIQEKQSGEETLKPVAVYDFEDGAGENTQALVKGLGAYNGEIQYAEGKDSEKAVKLGSYGLKLNQENLGETYTVSMWVKPDGTIKTNTPVIFLGYHNPEKWVGVSGENNNSSCKVWTNGSGFTWKTVTSLTLPAGEWNQITLTQKGDTLSVYKNGILMGSGTAAKALNGSGQDIYLGVNNWDDVFKGLIDEVKVYNQALTEEEIQKEDAAAYQEKLKESLEQGVKEEELLGSKNESADKTRYNLELPDTVNGMKVTWTSSEPEVITEKGVVYNPSGEKKVTLTAGITYGALSAEKSFTFTVIPMDGEELGQSIQNAEEALTSPFYTEESLKALEKAVERAKAALSQTQADAAVKAVERAIKGLSYREEYKNPFLWLEGREPAASVETEAGKSLQIFEVPEEIRDMVTVSCESGNPQTASYAGGVLTAGKAGTTTLTTVITAKYDGYAVRYRTVVKVKAAETPDKPSEPEKPAPDLSKVAVKAGKSRLAVNRTAKVQVTLPAEMKTENPKITYKAKGAVSVTKAGVIRGKKAGKGTVTVTVTVGSTSITRNLKISVGAIAGKSSIKVGKTMTLKVKGLSGRVKWSVNKKKYASISRKGKLTAKKKGRVVVTAKRAGVTMRKTIKIK